MKQSRMRERREDLRIMLLGKTGVGKSTSGNTILGREAFISDTSPCSVTTVCEKERAEVEGRNVYIVDTPGLFDTNYSVEVIKKEIAKSICLSSPGPHAFLVVIQLGVRFTQEEQDTVELIKKIFGTDSAKYTMVLFSHGDKLTGKTIEEYLSKSSQLKKFTAQCHGGYHVFNNEDPENLSQVTELLQKIDRMVTVNGRGYYTTEMYQQAEAEIEKRKAQILRETEEKRKREEEELEKRIKDAAELDMKRAREKFREEQEWARAIEEKRKRELDEWEKQIKQKEEMEKAREEFRKEQERAKEAEEKKKRVWEEWEKQRKQKEKLELQEAKEDLRKQQEENARLRAELDNKYIDECTNVGAIGGLIIGGLAGAAAGAMGAIKGAAAGLFMGGPVGAAVGAFGGAVVGAAGGAAAGAVGGAAVGTVGTAVGAAGRLVVGAAGRAVVEAEKKDECTIQ